MKIRPHADHSPDPEYRRLLEELQVWVDLRSEYLFTILACRRSGDRSREKDLMKQRQQCQSEVIKVQRAILIKFEVWHEA